MTNLKDLFIGIFLVLLSISANAQLVKRAKVDELAALCKVWGFMKYYHPNVAKGLINWDSVLIEHIPNVEAARNKKEFETVILRVINSAGEIPPCDTCKIKTDSMITFIDWSWIENVSNNTGIKSILKKLRSFKAYAPNVYITNIGPGGYVMSFPRITEQPYKEMQLPDRNYRLLSLFRIWNIIDYFFPYKNMMDIKWETTLKKFIPLFISADDTVQYHLVCKEFMTYLNDGHSYSSSQPSNKLFYTYRVPFKIEYAEGKYLVGKSTNDSLFALSGLQTGDIIETVDGQSVQQRKQYLSKYFGGSNKIAIEGVEIANVLLNSADSTGSITITRNGKKVIKKLNRYQRRTIQQATAATKEPMWKKISSDIGYVHMGLLTKRDTIKYLFDDLQKTKTIILDFRDYPSFSVIHEFLSYLYKENKPFAKFLSPVMEKPGYFIPNEGDFVFMQPKLNTYKGKIILLVNEHSGSLGEFFPMALQTLKNTITIGSQTWGADGNQVGTVLPGEIYVGFSGLGVSYPDGTICQRKGIKIDKIVKPTIKGIMEGRDELLEAAIKLVE